MFHSRESGHIKTATERHYRGSDMTNGSKKRLTTRKGKNSTASQLRNREVKPKSIGSNKGLIKAQVKRKEIGSSEFERTKAEVHELDEELDHTQQDEQLKDLFTPVKKEQLKLLDQSASKRITDIGSTTTSLLSKLDKEVSSMDDGDEVELKDFAEDLKTKAKKLIK